MAEDFQVDAEGGEFRVVAGQEMRAVWVPLSAADKKALVKKATSEGKAVGLMVAAFLKNYLKGEASELSLADLEAVAGGMEMTSQRVGLLYPSLINAGYFQQTPQRIPDLGRIASTVMCPW